MPLCPICESGGNAEFFCKGGRPLLICLHCRHIWWQDRPSDAELRDYYRSQYTGTHAQKNLQSQARLYYRDHVLELAALIHRRPAEMTIMDYGCSIPVLGHEAVKLGFQQVWGIDWADEARQFGRDWGVAVLSPHELSSVPERSVDIIRFSHTLEHSVDPLAVLRNLLPRMRPGGLVYVTQPNFPVFRPVQSSHDLLDTVYPEHLHFFSALSLIEMVSRLNLRITRFFSHQKAEEVVAKYGPILDLDYARERLAAYPELGDRNFSDLENYPYYAGENSVLHAIVR